MELIEKIRNEIKRRYKEFDGKTGDIATASRLAYLDVLSFLDTLQEPDVEYIRKDALMEWLNNSINEMEESRKQMVAFSLQWSAGAVAISAFIEVKDKLNSM